MFRITAPLIDLILKRSSTYSIDVLELQLGAKQQTVANHRQSLSSLHNQLLSIPSPKLRTTFSIFSEKGSSSWLTTLPLLDHGYTLAFVMPFVSDMVGGPPPCLQVVFVGSQ